MLYVKGGIRLGFDVDAYDNALRQKVLQLRELLSGGNIPDSVRSTLEIKLLAFEEARDMIRSMKTKETDDFENTKEDDE